MGPIKTLIHVHTDYSFDSNTSVEELAAYAEREGIGCIAVTDHDTINGARALARIATCRVIIGEEITTRDGHLIGLFLTHHVEPGMSARATAQAIRAQGGLVLAPHPFVRVLGCALGDVAWEIADLIDAVEVCNAQNLLQRPNRDADRFADLFDLPKYAGTDSHMSKSISPCHQMISAFDGPEGFLRSLRGAELVTGRHPLWYFAHAGVPDGPIPCRTVHAARVRRQLRPDCRSPAVARNGRTAARLEYRCGWRPRESDQRSGGST